MILWGKTSLILDVFSFDDMLVEFIVELMERQPKDNEK